MQVKKIIPALAVGLALGASQVGASTFSKVYVFGDSLSDAGASASAVESAYKLGGGKCDPLQPCPPYYHGRISNGPVTVEYLANALLVGGANKTNFFDYAVAGATSGVGNKIDGGTPTSFGTSNYPGMIAELGTYASGLGKNGANPAALYILWGGGNDILMGDSPITAADNIANEIDKLASSGAKNFLAPNMVDGSLIPIGVPNGTQLSNEFNQELALRLSQESAKFPNANIKEFDTYSFVNNLVANPGANGFTNVVDPCFSSFFNVCNNSNNYLFWDNIHFSTKTDSLLAEAMYNLFVPVPAAAWLFASGLAGIIGLKRR